MLILFTLVAQTESVYMKEKRKFRRNKNQKLHRKTFFFRSLNCGATFILFTSFFSTQKASHYKYV